MTKLNEEWSAEWSAEHFMQQNNLIYLQHKNHPKIIYSVLKDTMNPKDCPYCNTFIPPEIKERIFAFIKTNLIASLDI